MKIYGNHMPGACLYKTTNTCDLSLFLYKFCKREAKQKLMEHQSIIITLYVPSVAVKKTAKFIVNVYNIGTHSYT